MLQIEVTLLQKTKIAVVTPTFTGHGPTYDLFCSISDYLTIFLLVWECLLLLGYSIATTLPLHAVFAGRWLLIWLLGYYVAVSSPQSTYALCSVRFVIVEHWLLWPFYVACFPAARAVLSSFLHCSHWLIDRHPRCALPININICWLIDRHLWCELGLCDYAIHAEHNICI